MAHLVLLGPVIDAATENFAFGNRWYRPLAWDRRAAKPQWINRPYPLLTSHSYLPYPRSHGLYRRVAHWTASQITQQRLPEEDLGVITISPEDYPKTSLPQWVHAEWWASDTGMAKRVYWATVDLQLAYPSVSLTHLRGSLSQMVSSSRRELPQMADLLGGYPEEVRAQLARPEVRRQLSVSLVRHLEQVKADDSGIPEDGWKPPHALATLPPDNRGLPTGLAISGLLLNAALAPTDQRVLSHLRSESPGHRSAIVRFADDMIVLSRSFDGLVRTIDAISNGLAATSRARLSDGASKANLYLNIEKLNPDPVRKVVKEYLASDGWQKCDICGTLTPSVRPGTRGTTIFQWWRTQGVKTQQLVDDVERCAVAEGQLGPFVTALVERLSEIGKDTLSERFGAGARDRLLTLHDLARFDIDDLQVKDDTRRTFAANRLVRAWLPDELQHSRRAIRAIRESVAHVLSVTPWKFSLWGAVVRAAARRPSGSELNDRQLDDEEAAQWLARQLRRIAHVTDGEDSPESWVRTWPEVSSGPNEHARDNRWRLLFVSFHRAAFWQATVEVLLELWRHHDRATKAGTYDPGPSPNWWTVRAIPEGRHNAVAEFLGETDRWLRELVPGQSPELTSWTWELDLLCQAFLAGEQRASLARALRVTDATGQVVAVPTSLERIDRNPKTAGLLRECDRLKPIRASDRGKLGADVLVLLLLAGQDSKLWAVVSDGKADWWEARRSFLLAVSDELGFLEQLDVELEVIS